MKKFGFRLFIGIAAFSFGVVAVWALYSFWQQQVRQSEKIAVTENVKPAEVSEKKLVPTSPNGKIEVIFKGFKQTNEGLIFESEIINYNSKVAKYEADTKDAPFYDLKFDGKAERLMYCGTGTEKFEIPSGESIISQWKAWALEKYLYKKGDLQIGYGFVIKENRMDFFWSQKFQIPDEIKAQVEKEISDNLKKRNQ